MTVSLTYQSQIKYMFQTLDNAWTDFQENNVDRKLVVHWNFFKPDLFRHREMFYLDMLSEYIYTDSTSSTRFKIWYSLHSGFTDSLYTITTTFCFITCWENIGTKLYWLLFIRNFDNFNLIKSSSHKMLYTPLSPDRNRLRWTFVFEYLLKKIRVLCLWCTI